MVYYTCRSGCLTSFECTMLWVLAFLSVIHEGVAVVDCRVACRRCREKTDLAEMVEVYCAMCTECKERRIERMQAAALTTTTDLLDCNPIMQEVTDCPEPSCEHLEETQKLPLKKIRSTTTTTTTTQRPCPSTPCKKPTPCYCMPFMPMTMCPCPVQNPATTEMINQKLMLPDKDTDYTYVYVGVPNGLLSK